MQFAFMRVQYLFQQVSKAGNILPNFPDLWIKIEISLRFLEWYWIDSNGYYPGAHFIILDPSISLFAWNKHKTDSYLQIPMTTLGVFLMDVSGRRPLLMVSNLVEHNKYIFTVLIQLLYTADFSSGHMLGLFPSWNVIPL